MKLHLPKVLLLAALATVTAMPSYAESINVGLYEPDKKYGFVVTSDGLPLPSSDKYTYVHKENGVEVTSITLGKGDKLGALDSNGNFIEASGAKKYEGAGLGSYGGYRESESGVATKNFKINGTLTLTEDATVKLGGEVRFGGLGETIHEYIGIIADNVVVTGESAYMHTHSATLGTLTIGAGKVLLHTGKTNGNTSNILTAPKDSKQVRIASALSVSGGYLQIATENANKGVADDTQCITAFGKLNFEGVSYSGGEPVDATNYTTTSCQITQTGGTIVANGKSVSVGGLQINQQGGEMDISADDYHVIADYADSVISQTGSKSVMNLGKIITYNGYYEKVMAKLNEKGLAPDVNPTITITQTSGGVINVKGIDFTNQITQASSEQKSFFKQEGEGGIMNLSGEYKGADFDITQNSEGGTINLNGSMTAGAVTQSAGTLNIGTTDDSGKVLTTGNMTASSVSISGTLNVEDGSKLTAGSITVNGGTLVNSGTISGEQSKTRQMMAAASVDVIEIISGEVKNYGTIEQDILVSGGKLTLGAVEDGGKASVKGVTMTSGVINVEGQCTTGALTLEGGTITFMEKATLESESVSGLETVTITLNVSAETFADVVDGNGYADTLFTVAGTTALNDTKIYITSDSQKQEVYVKQDANGNVKVGQLAPEPTTATLSLLALAALAARRRRK